MFVFLIVGITFMNILMGGDAGAMVLLPGMNINHEKSYRNRVKKLEKKRL